MQRRGNYGIMGSGNEYRLEKESDQMRTSQKFWGLMAPAVLCTALWGSAAPCIKLGYRLFEIPAGDAFSQLTFAGWRFLLAGVLTLMVAVVLGRRPLLPNRSNIGAILAISLFQSMIQYVCYYIGLSYTTGAKGALLSGTQTFFAILFAHFLRRDDRIDLPKAVGCVLGFAGVVLLQVGGDLGGFSLKGDGLVLLSAASAGMGALVSRVVSPGRDPIILTAWQLIFGGGLLLALGYGGGGSIGTITLPGLVLLGYMIVLSAAAFTIWTMLLKKWPVGKVALYSFLIPVFGAVFSAIFLAETNWSLRSWGALALVSVGIAVASWVRPDKQHTA